MGAGQASLRFGLGIDYASAGFASAIVPVLVAMLVLLAGLAGMTGLPLARSGLGPPSARALGLALVVAVLTIGLAALPILGFAGPVPPGVMRQVFGLIAVMGLVALAEEIAFRGLILFALDRMAGPIVAIAGSALLFAAYHTVNLIGGRGLDAVAGQMLGSSLLGVALGGLAWRTGSITLPVALHWHVNVLLGLSGLLSSAFRL